MSHVSTPPLFLFRPISLTVFLRTADIVFTGADAVLPKDAMTTNYITQFSTLKSMGDSMTSALAANLGLSGSRSSSGAAADDSEDDDC